MTSSQIYANWWEPRREHVYSEEQYGLDAGINATRGVQGIETQRPLSIWIQDVVIYLLSFVSIIAVIYIIYAGFRIMIGNGDEEQLKKSRMTIIYVIIGIVIMWLAWSITRFILNLF